MTIEINTPVNSTTVSVKYYTCHAQMLMTIQTTAAPPASMLAPYDYANDWAGSDGRLMIVEYSPTDIVSVPEESGYGKLRVCKYTVIAEHTGRSKLNNGAYGNQNNINLTKVFDWLDERVHYQAVSYTDARKQFPGITMHDIKDAIETHSNIT